MALGKLDQYYLGPSELMALRRIAGSKEFAAVTARNDSEEKKVGPRVARHT